jgi:hypothetical protein
MSGLILASPAAVCVSVCQYVFHGMMRVAVTLLCESKHTLTLLTLGGQQREIYDKKQTIRVCQQYLGSLVSSLSAGLMSESSRLFPPSLQIEEKRKVTIPYMAASLHIFLYSRKRIILSLRSRSN